MVINYDEGRVELTQSGLSRTQKAVFLRLGDYVSFFKALPNCPILIYYFSEPLSLPSDPPENPSRERSREAEGPPVSDAEGLHSPLLLARGSL